MRQSQLTAFSKELSSSRCEKRRKGLEARGSPDRREKSTWKRRFTTAAKCAPCGRCCCCRRCIRTTLPCLLIPRQHHRQLDVRLIAPTPLEPEPWRRPRSRRQQPDSQASAPTSASSRLPALSADDLWGLLQGDLIAHLEPAQRVRIRPAIDVLLSKISMAERAERACATTLRPGYSPAAAALTARRGSPRPLERADGARSLEAWVRRSDGGGCNRFSQVLTARTPTWPESRELPPAFKSEVSGLLDQQRALCAPPASPPAIWTRERRI